MKLIKRIFKKENFKRDFITALLAAMLFSMIFSLAEFEAKCEDLKENVLRLHIIANSNSAEDQAIKLKIRDELLKNSNGLFETANNKEAAIEMVNNNTDFLTAIAEEVLIKEGKNQPVSISIGKTYFDTRVYEDFTLPAGEYDAVRVLIGKAEGKNWWCVMFPSMCVPAAEKEHKLTEAVDEKSAEIAENAPRYEMRFKIIEWYEAIKNKLKNF
ncbi:MAG: stage II sporulation protein R [Ruminococcaceae bacterium]|nr:stage II sporulation protein R [Oscillospiraceae bacterium]